MKRSKIYVAGLLVSVLIAGTGCPHPHPEPEPPNDYYQPSNFTPDTLSGNVNGFGWVDLGLPSGTLWAVCNVGARDLESAGWRFAWGETLPKQKYWCDNYKYMTMSSSVLLLTKYNTDPAAGLEGYVDGLTTLEPSDDAATVLWGAEWRTPTYDDLLELTSECSWREYPSDFFRPNSSCSGFELTGPNGRTLLFPRDEEHYDFEGGDVWTSVYMSSTLCDNPSFVKGRGYYGMDEYWRISGMLVRPVLVQDPRSFPSDDTP